LHLQNRAQLRVAACSHCNARPPAARGSPLAARAALLQRKYPGDELLDVGVGHEPIGRHGNLAPYANAALLDLVGEHRGRFLIAFVLRRDLLKRRADHFLVDRVAGGAAVFLHHLFGGLVVQRRRRAAGCEDAGCEEDQLAVHLLSV
jgi:hypothetical protein